MALPRIAGRKSIRLILEPGSYSWCACGTSKAQPFSDSSCACNGPDFKAVTFEIKERQQVKLCTCKHTRTPPLCDHTHRTLPPEA